MSLLARSRKGLALVIALAVAAALTAGLFVFKHYRDMAVEQAFSRLALFHGLRKATLEDHMRSKASDVRAMARNKRVRDALMSFSAAWSDIPSSPEAALKQLYVTDNPFRKGQKKLLRSAGDESPYTKAHADFHDWARRFLDHFGYEDVYLIDRDGNILYTVEKFGDFATNLNSGPHSDSPLAPVYQRSVRRAADRITVSDFEPYEPGDGEPSAFAGGAILGEDDKIAGVFAVRFSGDEINDILGYVDGMGKTGETYVVGNDLRMRSQSRFISKPTMLKTVVDTEPANNSLGGFSGAITGRTYRPVQVLSVYSGLDVGGPLWGLIAEMAESEVVEKVKLWPALLAALVAALVSAAAANLAYRLYSGD